MAALATLAGVAIPIIALFMNRAARRGREAQAAKIALMMLAKPHSRLLAYMADLKLAFGLAQAEKKSLPNADIQKTAQDIVESVPIAVPREQMALIALLNLPSTQLASSITDGVAILGEIDHQLRALAAGTCPSPERLEIAVGKLAEVCVAIGGEVSRLGGRCNQGENELVPFVPPRPTLAAVKKSSAKTLRRIADRIDPPRKGDDDVVEVRIRPSVR